METQTGHRPWPLPDRRWTVAMNWHDLLFMHWPVSISSLRPLVPIGLEIDTFDGSAWLGVIPFHMSGVRPRMLPGILASQFPELNVRTYVKCAGKAGVWFFSLDAANWLAVQTAQRFYHLPYRHARMSTANLNDTIRYASRRIAGRGGIEAEFVGEYKPTAPVLFPPTGSFDYFLTERYCLFSADSQGRIYCGDIHHARWPLQMAEADVQINSMTAPLGLKIPDTKPVLHFAKKLEVVAWPLKLVR